MVGPITVQPTPSPLPPDLIYFINSAGGNGFIIVSFGSYVQTVISKAKIDIMASAFGKLKQKVIWKLKGNSDLLVLYILLINLAKPKSVAPGCNKLTWLDPAIQSKASTWALVNLKKTHVTSITLLNMMVT